MSVNPSTAPYRTAYIRGTDGLYYKIGGGTGAGGEDEVYVGSTAPAAPFDGQMWVDTTGQGGGGGTGTDVDEVHVGPTAPPAPFDGQMWVDTTGEGGGGAGAVILSGTSTPTNAIGAVGNYYLDTDDNILYGPKAAETVVDLVADPDGHTFRPAGGGTFGPPDSSWWSMSLVLTNTVPGDPLRYDMYNGGTLVNILNVDAVDEGPFTAGATVDWASSAGIPGPVWTHFQLAYGMTGTNWVAATNVQFSYTSGVVWPVALKSGLTQAEIDALFLKPSEIVAGSNITVTPSGGSVTIASTGGAAAASDVSGRWTFSTGTTAFAGGVWVDNPSGQYGGNRLMMTGVDAAGTNHDIAFDFLRPGDSLFLQKGIKWSDGDGASYTIRHRSATFNATLNTYVYTFGVVRTNTDNFVPAIHTNGQPVRLYWYYNRKYGPGDYLLNENDNGGTSPDRGMIRFNGNPYSSSLASLTMMYVSENDLAGHLSYLSLYNLVSGNQMRLSLGQGGEILLACSGTVVYATDATSGQYTFRIPVTVTSRTGYLGQMARLEVIRGTGSGGLTQAEADALFLKPSEILAGSNVSVSTAAGAVTISATGGGSTYTRATVSLTTASLATGASEKNVITLAPGYRILRVDTSKAARVRLYLSTAYQDDDLDRAAGADLENDHGVVLDVVTTSEVHTLYLSPQVDGHDIRSTPTGSIPITITNLDATTGTVSVTLSWIRTE